MAIKVGGTTVIDDTRQLTNIASVDAATVTALSNAGVGGGGGVVQMTASGGDITAGDIVTLNADGTITEVTVPGGATTIPVELAGLTHPTGYGVITYDSVNNLFVSARYVSQNLYVRFGSLSGSTVTWDASETIVTGQTESVNTYALGYDPTSNNYIIIWLTSNAYLRGTAFTYSNGTVTTGTKGGELGGNSYIQGSGTPIFLLYDDNRSAFVLSFFHQNNNRIEHYLLTVSNRTITNQSSEGIIDSATADQFSSVYSTTDDAVFTIAYLPSFGQTSIRMTKIYSGFYQFQRFSERAFNPTGFPANPGIMRLAYNSTDNEFLLLFAENNTIKAVTFTYDIATDTYSYGTIVSLLDSRFNDVSKSKLIYNPADNNYLYTSDQGYDQSFPYRNNGFFIEASGDTITVSNTVDLGKNAPDPTTEYRQFLYYVDDLNTLTIKLYDGTGDIYSVEGTRVPDWVGIAKENITNNTAGDIYVLSGVSEDQTGLTPGAKYYLEEGSKALTTTVTSYPIGKALTANKLLITESN